MTKFVTSIRTTFQYDAADRRTVKRLRNGTRASFTYDAADRVTRIVNIKSSGVIISSFTYTYDNTTNRTRMIESSGDRVTWTYDATYQLTRERRSVMNSYDVTHVYDPAGNRTVKIDSGARTTAVYDAANRITYSQDGTGRTTYTYDSNGNQTRRLDPAGARTTSVWDYENMNTVIRLPGGTRLTNSYDGDLKRVQQLGAAVGAQQYFYDENRLLTITTDTMLRQIVYSEPTEYATVLYQNFWLTSGYAYHHYDALGNTDALTDSAQVPTDTYTYLAFGELKASSGTTPNVLTWVGEKGYIRDVESGEYKAGERPIQPALARWKSEDRLGPTTSSSNNPFSYVDNNPVNVADPSGNIPDDNCDRPEPPELPQDPPMPVRCGPDIGLSLTVTFNEVIKRWRKKSYEVIKRWRKKSYFVRHALCNAGGGGGPGGNSDPVLGFIFAWRKWDLWFSEIPLPTGCGKCVKPFPGGQACGNSSCYAVFGKKHREYDINYALFGLLSRLCGWQLYQALFLVALHKDIYMTFKGCPSQFTKDVILWTIAGYRFGVNGWFLPGGALEDLAPRYDNPVFSDCPLCPTTIRPQIIPWNWFTHFGQYNEHIPDEK